MLELGFELVKTLGRSADHDLLANWMAHHLAGKLALEKMARGASKKSLSDECAELILRLWEHRHSLPDGARPFESFEPIFQTLHELSANKARNIYLRAAPAPITASSHVKDVLSAALAIDEGASLLIRCLLAEVVTEIPSDEKRWSKLRAAMKPSHWDVQVVVRLIDDAKESLDDDQQLQTAAAKELEDMIKRLQALSAVATQIERQFAERVESLRGSGAGRSNAQSLGNKQPRPMRLKS